MLSENGDVIKNRHDRAPAPSTVSIQMGDRRCHVASLLIGVVVWTGENDTRTISADANLFENGANFSFENGLVWTGPKSI